MPHVNVKGIDLYYESTGEGEPLVLVHGGFLDHTMWILNVPGLAERFRVVTIDLPGHSQSGGTIDKSMTVDEAMDLMVEHVAGLIEQLDLAPAHIVGTSFGGGVVLHLAVRCPDLFRSMSLHEPATIALLDDEFKAVRDAQKRAFSLISAGDIDGGLQAFVDSVGGDWSQMPEPFKAIFFHNARQYAGAAVFDDPARALTVPDGLGAFPHPVQFTQGDQSPPFFRASTERVAALLPDPEIVTIEGGSHAAMLDRPTEYVAALTDFIERARVDAVPGERRTDVVRK